jgi:hypothetical protein
MWGCISILLFYLPFQERERRQGERRERKRNGDGDDEKSTKLCQECAISRKLAILCVASFYIASFLLNLDNRVGVRVQWKIRRRQRWTFSGPWQSENERKAMNIIKYILVKWQKQKYRKRKNAANREKGLSAVWKKPLECGKFRKFSFRIAPRPTSSAKCLNVSKCWDLLNNTVWNLRLELSENYEAISGHNLMMAKSSLYCGKIEKFDNFILKFVPSLRWWPMTTRNFNFIDESFSQKLLLLINDARSGLSVNWHQIFRIFQNDCGFDCREQFWRFYW